MKAKGNDILISMIYAYAVQQPKHDWYMQTDKDTFVSIRKIYEKFDSTTWLLLPQFHAVTGCDRVSYFFNVSKRVVFERASSGITTFNMIVELGSSNITTESVNYEVTKSILKVYFTVVRKWKELMRLERDKTMKLKRKQRKFNSAH